MRWSALHACIAGAASIRPRPATKPPRRTPPPPPGAARHGDVLRLLLHRHAFVDALDAHCRTPAMYAAIVDDPEALQLLIQAGADLSMKDVDGNTALHLAYMYCSSRCRRLLLASGGVDEEGTNLSGRTPLDVAGRGKSVRRTIFYEERCTS